MFDLSIIKESSILSKDDFSFLANASDELRDALQKRQVFRTETEMYISVLDDIKHPTNASKYWQAVREQAVMLENLLSAGFDYRRNEVQIKRIRKKMMECIDALDHEELQIDMDECLFKKSNIETVAKDRIRELRLWSRIKGELDDSSFDTSDVNKHQLVSYAKRFILQASNAPENTPIAEANNLKGQLISAIRELDQAGALHTAVNGLPEDVVRRVLIEPGIVRVGVTEQLHQ